MTLSADLNEPVHHDSGLSAGIEQRVIDATNDSMIEQSGNCQIFSLYYRGYEIIYKSFALIGQVDGMAQAL